MRSQQPPADILYWFSYGQQSKTLFLFSWLKAHQSWVSKPSLKTASPTWSQPPCKWLAQTVHGLFLTFFLSRESRVSEHACCYSLACFTFTFGSCPILLNCINCMNWAAAVSRLWSRAALGFIMEVVEGWLEGGKEQLLIHFPSRWSSSPKPPAVPCRLPLPYHNSTTNGAMKHF